MPLCNPTLCVLPEHPVEAINQVLHLAGGSYAVALASLAKHQWQVIELETCQSLAPASHVAYLPLRAATGIVELFFTPSESAEGRFGMYLLIVKDGHAHSVEFIIPSVFVTIAELCAGMEQLHKVKGTGSYTEDKTLEWVRDPVGRLSANLVSALITDWETFFNALYGVGA